MNQPEKKTVFIIPSLKELSKSETKFGKIDEKCGQLGFTNENCMADYNKDLGYKVKRENYTELGKMGENANVNSYLLNSEIDLGINFEVVKDLTPLIIDEHNDNWKVLFNILNKQTENLHPNEGKGIIYVAGHQHNFQKKLFKFEKLSNPKKKYGFYNGSVVKVYKDGEDLQVKMAYVPKIVGGKDKYEYIKENTVMKDVLKKGSMESIQEHKLLDFFDVYFIRHGTALHNIKKVKDKIKQKYLLNSPLLKVGKKQALEINTILTDTLPGKEHIILFSSPLDRAVETGILSAYGEHEDHTKLHERFKEMLQSTTDKSGANKYMESIGGRKTKKSNYKSRTKQLKKRQTRKRRKTNIKLSRKINRKVNRKTKRSRN